MLGGEKDRKGKNTKISQKKSWLLIWATAMQLLLEGWTQAQG